MSGSRGLTHEALSAIPPSHRPVAFPHRDAPSATAAPRQRPSGNPSAASAWRAGNPGVALRPSRISIRGRNTSPSEAAPDALGTIAVWAAAATDPRPARTGRRSADPVNGLTAQVLSSPGSPLPANLRTDMEDEVSALLVSPVMAGRHAAGEVSERQAATVATRAVGHRGASAGPDQPNRHHFGDVRIHADGIAATSATMLSARAYTLGTHIVFGPGEYAPSTQDGRRILAHELTHGVQQRDLPTPGRLVQRTEFGDSVRLDSLAGYCARGIPSGYSLSPPSRGCALRTSSSTELPQSSRRSRTWVRRTCRGRLDDGSWKEPDKAVISSPMSAGRPG